MIAPSWQDLATSVSWVQRDSVFLKILDGIALAIAIVYLIVYFREGSGSARTRRMRSALISAIGLICFTIFLAARVFVLHE
jgi:hypothetical protein